MGAFGCRPVLLVLLFHHPRGSCAAKRSSLDNGLVMAKAAMAKLPKRSTGSSQDRQQFATRHVFLQRDVSFAWVCLAKQLYIQELA